jgi:hypothetical protein
MKLNKIIQPAKGKIIPATLMNFQTIDLCYIRFLITPV